MRDGSRKILFWNIAGMKEVNEAREEMEKNEIVILVETWVTQDRVKEESEKLSNKYKWWAKNAVKEGKRGRAKGGQLVGIKKEIEKGWDIKEWKYGLTLENNKKEGEVIITVYNNVGMKQLETELRKEIEEGANRNKKVVIIGDFNARIGEEDRERDEEELERKKRRSKDKVLNNEGRKLLNMCEELGLSIWNGRAKNDEEGEITFVGGKEECLGSVIDLVMTVDRGDNEEMELKIIERIESDHLPLQIRYDIERQENENEEEKAEEGEELRLDGKKLKWKKENKQEYTEATHEALKEILREKEELEWEDIKEIIRKAAERGGMLVKDKDRENKKERKKWFNEECKKRRKEVWNDLKLFIKNRSVENKIKLKESRREYKNKMKESKEKWYEGMCEEISKAKDMSKWWEAINRFRGKKRKSVSNKITAERWENHFNKLLNGEETEESEEEDEPWNEEIGNEDEVEASMDEKFSSKEIWTAIRKLGNNKAPGEDGIAAEFIKNMVPEGVEWIREILNKMWEDGYMPEGWDTAVVVPLFKSGDEEVTGNYRGISLLDSGYKLMTTMMTERINRWIENRKILKESQAGFRKRRGTRDHIFVLNGLINNKLKAKGGKLYIALVDFKAAFDKVGRGKMKRKAWTKGIRGNMHRMIRVVYKETYCKVKVGTRKTTKKFRTKKGVRQGCAMSGAMYGMGIDGLEEQMEKKKIGGTVIGKQRVYAMKYADDVALVADSGEELRGMLKELGKYAKENKMEVNVGKTKTNVGMEERKKRKKNGYSTGGKLKK